MPSVALTDVSPSSAPLLNSPEPLSTTRLSRSRNIDEMKAAEPQQPWQDPRHAVFDPDSQPMSGVNGTDVKCFIEPLLYLGRCEGGRRSRGACLKTSIGGALSCADRVAYCYMRDQYIANIINFNAVGFHPLEVGR